MKGRRAVLILKILMLCACLAIVVAGSAREAGSVALLDVPIPSIVEEPSHTVGTSNVVFWSPVIHTDLTAYRVQVSLASSFDSIWLSRVVGAGWDSTTFTGLPLDTMWYRVQAAYIPAADTFWSEWSAPTFSIQDVDPPNTDCDLDPAGEWSTLDSFTFSYLVEDPAGIDSVSLYRRIGDSDPWTMFDSLKPADSPMVVVGVIKFSSANDLEGDAHYQFFIGGRDNAKADNWDTTDTRSVGNVIKPTAGSPAMCEIKVDTRLPLSEIDASFEDDSLHTSLEFDIPYWARDSNTATGFVSGLDTVYLYWGVDSGAINPTVSQADIVFDSVVILETPGGADEVSGSYAFPAPYDTSIYCFYTIAVDVAGNRQVDSTIYCTRVFTTLEATLTLFDTVDISDSEYTGHCAVKAVVDFNVPAVDSLMLCEDSLFTQHCLVKNSQSTRPYTTEWLFSDCSDGEKFLYGIVWVGGKPDTISASIVLDTTPPDLVELYLFDLRTMSRDFTDNRLVGVSYRGIDLPFNELQWLVVSEDSSFASADSAVLGLGVDEPQFLLSSDFDRKTVYGFLVDRAEHESDTLTGSIILFEHTHNYPNPFNPDIEVTNLVFTLAKNEKVTILIYDLFGNLVYENSVAGVAGLNDGVLQWDGRNMHNTAVADGGYICVLKAGDREISKHKIAVIR